jgi:hypothetical protein
MVARTSLAADGGGVLGLDEKRSAARKPVRPADRIRCDNRVIQRGLCNSAAGLME